MRLILVRHGESEGNVDPAYYLTTPDSKVPLTNKGKNQAIEAGKKIEKRIWARDNVTLVTSPYLRAKQTANIINGVLGSTFKVEEDILIRELQYPNITTMEERAEFHKRRDADFFFYREGSGESYADLVQRVQVFLNKIALQDDNYLATKIVVCHQRTIEAFLLLIDKKEYINFYQDIKNCEIIERII